MARWVFSPTEAHMDVASVTDKDNRIRRIWISDDAATCDVLRWNGKRHDMDAVAAMTEARQTVPFPLIHYGHVIVKPETIHFDPDFKRSV